MGSLKIMAIKELQNDEEEQQVCFMIESVQKQRRQARQRLLVFAGLFALMGTVALVVTNAAPASNGKASEAEGFNTSQSIATLSDSTASGGQYVLFGGSSGGVAASNYLQFDGVDDYVNLGPVPMPGNELTLEALVDADTLTGCPSFECRIISKASSTSGVDHYFMLGTVNSGGDAVLRFRLRTSGATETLIANMGNLIVDADARDVHHVAATYDGATMRLYLDGVEVGSVAKTGAIEQNNAVDTWIGGNPDGPTSRPWHGSIDDVRIWNTARTQAEISANKDVELTGSETGLMHYYTFNSASGQAVVDQAGSNDTVLGSTSAADTNDPNIVINTPDTVPPSAPTNLAAANITGNTVDLSWTQATDDRAVDEYIIYQDGAQVATVLHPTTSFTVTGLSPVTNYDFTVYAEDDSNNRSPASNTVQTTTLPPDVTPPSTPAGLTVTDATSTSIDLSWNTATDNIGVTAYVINRDGTDIATILEPQTMYTDGGLQPQTTHTYTVRATDAAGNHSPQSGAVNGDTLAVPDVCSWDGNPNNPTDDPNPDYNGTVGRLPVSANPVPAGYPTPLTTGLCGVGLQPSDLTPTSGRTINTDGAVIDGEDISGTLTISANNVTVRNTRITSTGLYTLRFTSGYTGLTVEDVRIRSDGNNGAAVHLLGFTTFRRVHVSGGNDNFKAYGGVLVEDSYFAGLYKAPGTHNDVVQIRSGSNYTFRRNTMIGNWQQQTSVFLFQTGSGPIDNILVEDNYLSGANFTIYTREEDYPFTNGLVRNNRFELNSWQFGWRSDDAGVTYTGNIQVPSN